MSTTTTTTTTTTTRDRGDRYGRMGPITKKSKSSPAAQNEVPTVENISSPRGNDNGGKEKPEEESRHCECEQYAEYRIQGRTRINGELSTKRPSLAISRFTRGRIRVVILQ